jgi:hypothetical protein
LQQHLAMNNVFLHMGFHKTASSSFQETCRQYGDELARQGFLYPVFECTQDGRKIHNHSVPLFSVFTENPADYHVNILTEIRDVDRVNTAYREQFARCLQSGRDVIISGEDISKLSKAGLGALLTFMRQTPVRLVPIAYIRSPYEFHCSSAQQIVAGGNPVDFCRLNTQRSVIEKVLDVFAGEIHLFSFAEALQHARGPVGHLFEFMGVSMTRIEPLRTNERHSNLYTRVQNQLNRLEPAIIEGHGGGSARTRNRRHIKLKDPGGDKFLLTQRELDAIRPALEAESDFFRRRLGAHFCDREPAVTTEPGLPEVARLIACSFEGFVTNLSHDTVNFLRNVALQQQDRNLDVALELMTLAHLSRPEGPLIRQLLEEMRQAATAQKKA